MSLSPEQKAAYDRDGVTRLGQVLSAAELAEARRRFEQLFQARVGTTDRGLRDIFASGADADKKPAATQKHYQFYNIWEHDDWFRQLLYKPALLDLVQAVLGPNIQLVHDQVFYKPAGDGAPSHWHQDNSYFCFTPPHVVSIWIALDDVDEENSCLYFLPGSQRLGPLEPKSVTLPSGITVHELPIDEQQLEPFPMPAGHGLMHHCLTVHGARANRSNRGRRSLGIHYMQPGLQSQGPHQSADLKKHPILRGHAP